MREAECAELTDALRREAARLRGVRARVREAIASDAALAPRDRDRRPVAEDPDLSITNILSKNTIGKVMV